MTDIRGIVQQDTYTSAGEQAFIGARANPRGELVTPDWMTQLVMDGRVYNVSNAARETALAVGGTSFSDTALWYNYCTFGDKPAPRWYRSRRSNYGLGYPV